MPSSLQRWLFAAGSSNCKKLMAKSMRTRRARNKINGSSDGALIHANPLLESSIAVHRSTAVSIARPTLFTAEFEEVIDLIARDRVYRAMLARWGRLLLVPPTTNSDIFNA